MNSAATLPPALAVPLEGLQVIEASAGTGKTWTISGLYLRLILEREVPVEKILVMSFARAATAELRERIRARVQGTLDLLEGRDNPDELCRLIAERVADPDRARRLLSLAVQSFDDAAVHTLHAFCQRVLEDHTFTSGSLARCEVVADDSEVLHEVVADFWRTHFHPCGSEVAQRLRAAWMQSKRFGLDELENWVRRVRTTRFSRIEASTGEPLDAAAAAFAAAWGRVSSMWQREAAKVRELLEKHPGLDRRSYQYRWIGPWCQQLDLAFSGGDGALDDLPGSLERFGTVKLATKGAPPVHPFFEEVDLLLSGAERLRSALESDWRACRLAALERARTDVARRLAERQAQSYDDLLEKVASALAGRFSSRLTEALRARYPCALIDEFQDTDTLQWSIFRKLYHGAPGTAAFLVGDPKQAIYQFRGADVYAYLRATDDCPAPIRLAENQRSADGLVRAVNALFGSREDPFREPRIVFEPVASSARNAAVLVDNGVTDAAPLRFFSHPGDAQGKTLAKGAGRAWASELCAREIARLLHDDIRLDGEALRAGQIAVLVNTHLQASLVREALALRGIGATELSNDSVLQSRTAEQVEQLLVAVFKPRDTGCLRTALASDLLAYSAARLRTLEEDEANWDRLILQFDDLNLLWQRHGVMHMLRRALQVFDIPRKLAAMRDGERRLTDFLHVAEVLHTQEQGGARMDRLLVNLAALRNGGSSEDTQLRLESDGNLVQILTIHRSKGLEFPVTFVPFLWEVRTPVKDDICAYHEEAPPHDVVLDASSAGFASALLRSQHEEISERLRLAYVALTRAKKRCYVFTGAHKTLPPSALGWLLHRLDGATMTTAASLPQVDQELRELCTRSGCMQVIDHVPDVARHRDDASSTSTLAAAHMQRRLSDGFVQTSFTGLVHAVERAASEAVVADHDQLSLPHTADDPPAPGGDRFAFPRGARAGICLHGIFETLSFAHPGKWLESVQAGLRGAGFEPGWAEATHLWLREILHTPLPDGMGGAFALAEVASEGVKRELGFHLATPSLVPAALARIALRHGVPVSPLAGNRVGGYLSGFVDLVFQHRDRWYVVDYKSNWLGATAAAYAQDGLARAMAEGDYHLQYLLYSVALRRLLRLRMPGFDADRDFGGVLYLFLRGMRPDWRDEQGRPLGVYVSRPDSRLLDAIDGLLRGAGAPTEPA